jgi:hypothetical protein
MFEGGAKLSSYVLVALALLGCSASSPAVPPAREASKADQTVYVGGFQWGQPSSFNPLASAPDWPCNAGNAQNLFYEPLQAPAKRGSASWMRCRARGRSGPTG